MPRLWHGGWPWEADRRVRLVRVSNVRVVYLMSTGGYPHEELLRGMDSPLAVKRRANGEWVWDTDFMKQSMEARAPGRGFRQLQLAEHMRGRVPVFAILLDMVPRAVQTLIDTCEWSMWPMFDEIERAYAFHRKHAAELDAAMGSAVADVIAAKGWAK